jgi:glycosyltransferase involved in cell wall biosynthesis
MTILYFYQYFSTPNGSWGTRVYEFARKWVEQGHRVIVVTSIYKKSDLKATKFIETQIVDGIELKVINIDIDNKLSISKRVTGFVLYSIIASYYAISIKCDRVIASSGPITVAFPGLAAKLIRKRKLIFEVRDLWPQGAIELGILKSPLVKYIAYKVEKFTYQKSDLIVTLSSGMIDNINCRYGLGNKCICIPNSVNLLLFSYAEHLDNVKKINPSYSYAIYTGNIGEVNNSVWLLNASRELKLRGVQDVKILIIGDGQQKEYIKKCIKNEKLDALLVLDLMPKKELVPLLQRAMVSLVPLKGTPILDTSSPNKFFESLGAGVPVIQNTNGWMKSFLMQNDVGTTIGPDDHINLVNELIRFKSISIEEKLKIKNRCIDVANQFDSTKLSELMIDSIIKL